MPITVMEVQGDGVPDNPGRVIWDKPVRTGQKDNYATNMGISATISFPLDGGLPKDVVGCDSNTNAATTNC